MPGKMEKILLYEEYRLIEREESEINGAWKGVHLILFFLAFVFGCICTFSFHILMYLFDDKCVLYPKLLSLRKMKRTIDANTMIANEDTLPVDFVSTQWMDSSTCYLPTFVPLVSGIFGLVWTTIFFMCSAGNRTLTGLQRPWRILPPIFIFSSFMGGLSFYTSYITHSGLNNLCEKLSEITGSKTCTYIVNIVTLAYERRIRGVYQVTQITIITAWAHTICWLLAAVVALARVLLVIDFRLVRIQAELQGDIEKMLERHEQHVRTISPDAVVKTDAESTPADIVDTKEINDTSADSMKMRFVNKSFSADSDTKINMEGIEIRRASPSLRQQNISSTTTLRSIEKAVMVTESIELDEKPWASTASEQSIERHELPGKLTSSQESIERYLKSKTKDRSLKRRDNTRHGLTKQLSSQLKRAPETIIIPREKMSATRYRIDTRDVSAMPSAEARKVEPSVIIRSESEKSISRSKTERSKTSDLTLQSGTSAKQSLSDKTLTPTSWEETFRLRKEDNKDKEANNRTKDTPVDTVEPSPSQREVRKLGPSTSREEKSSKAQPKPKKEKLD